MTYVTKAEIARRLGVQQNVVTNWEARHASFPEPWPGVVGTKVWDWNGIRLWSDLRAYAKRGVS